MLGPRPDLVQVEVGDLGSVQCIFNREESVQSTIDCRSLVMLVQLGVEGAF